jgi:hypothetical protein
MAARTRTSPLPVFVVLQCLDALTTLVFLSRGIAEGNPLVGWALLSAQAPWVSLIAVKSIAMLIGLYCYRTGRITALRLANAGYFLVVGWNLVAIAIAVIAR